MSDRGYHFQLASKPTWQAKVSHSSLHSPSVRPERRGGLTVRGQCYAEHGENMKQLPGTGGPDMSPYVCFSTSFIPSYKWLWLNRSDVIMHHRVKQVQSFLFACFMSIFVSHAATADRNVKAAAANTNASWQNDGNPACKAMGNWLCLISLMPAASEWNQLLSHNHTSLAHSISACLTAESRNPDRSLAATTLHPHCQTIWTHCSMETTPPLGLLSC